MVYDSSNAFAKIVRGELPCVKLYEDERTLAFLDIMPSVEGHTLVIPKAAAETIFDLSPEDAAALIQTVQRVAKAVKRALVCPGLMLAQLNGAAAGQSVRHIHFHIVPRAEGIDLKLHGRAMAKPEDLEGTAAKIRAALQPEF